MRNLAWSISILLASACTLDSNDHRDQTEKAPHEWVDSLGIQGLLLGLQSSQSIDTVWQVVSKNEKEWRLSRTGPDGLQLEAYLTWDGPEVYEVTIDWLSKNLQEHRLLYGNLQDRLNRLYGQGSPTEGFATWSFPSAEGRLIEVTLYDERPDIDTTRIMLNWLEYEDRLYLD